MRLSADNLSIWYTANKLWAQIASWPCRAVCANLSRVCAYPRQDMPIANSSHHACPEPCYAAEIVYRHILLGENSFDIIRTRAHEKIRLDFFRAEPLYVLYIAGKNVKKCKVRSCLCALDPSIFHFIWVKHGGKIWKLEPSNQICKKMEMAWEVGIYADYTMQTVASCAYCTMPFWRLWRLYTARTMPGI